MLQGSRTLAEPNARSLRPGLGRSGCSAWLHHAALGPPRTRTGPLEVNMFRVSGRTLKAMPGLHSTSEFTYIFRGPRPSFSRRFQFQSAIALGKSGASMQPWLCIAWGILGDLLGGLRPNSLQENFGARSVILDSRANSVSYQHPLKQENMLGATQVQHRSAHIYLDMQISELQRLSAFDVKLCLLEPARQGYPSKASIQVSWPGPLAFPLRAAPA